MKSALHRLLPSFATGTYLLILALVSVVISYTFMMGESLRLDEAQSIWQTSHSLSRTLEIVAQDVHMPMYHILLHYWMILFGPGVEAVRTLSLVFFIACIPVLYLLARTLLARRWSLVVVTLFVFSPFMIWYASEARMYTLLTFFALLSQYFYARILQGKQGWGGYAITAILGVYSHYFFLFTLAAQAVFYLLNRKRFKPGSLKRFALTALATIGSIAPWIYYFVSQGAAGNTRPSLPEPSSVDFFNVFSQFFFGFQTDAVNTIILSSWPILVVIALFAVQRRMKIDTTVFYLLIAGLLPVVLAFFLSYLVAPFFLGRYMMPSIAPLLIVSIWFVSQYSRKISLPIVSSMAVISLSMFGLQMTSTANPIREKYKAAAKYVAERSSVSDVVVLTSPFTVYAFEYYYQGDNQIRTLPLWDRQNTGNIPEFDEAKLEEEVEQLKKGRDHIYLLASRDQGYQDEITQYFLNRYEQTDTREYSDDMTLYVFRVGYNPVPVITP